jgi:hypothetical protein
MQKCFRRRLIAGLRGDVQVIIDVAIANQGMLSIFSTILQEKANSCGGFLRLYLTVVLSQP